MEQKLVAVTVNKAGFEYDIHSLVKAFYPECDVKVSVEGQDVFYSSSEDYPDLSISFQANPLKYASFLFHIRHYSQCVL